MISTLPKHRNLAIFPLFVLLILLSILISPSRAYAHGIGGIEASETVTKVDSIDPKTTDFTVKAIENGSRIRLTRTSNKDVILLGVDNEPYILINDNGTYMNMRSATRIINKSTANTVVSPEKLKDEFNETSSDPNAKPSWIKLSDSQSHDFHDHRAHYMGIVPNGVTNIGKNTLPIQVNNQLYTVNLHFETKQQNQNYLPLLLLIFVIVLISAFAVVKRDLFINSARRSNLILYLALIFICESLHLLGYLRLSQYSFFSELGAIFYGLILLILCVISIFVIAKDSENTGYPLLNAHAPLLSATGFIGVVAGAVIEYKSLIYPYPASTFSKGITVALILAIALFSTIIFWLGMLAIRQQSEIKSSEVTSVNS